MKSLLVRHGFLAAIILLAGCAHQLRFRAVDGSSGDFLPGADVKLRERGCFYYFEREPHGQAVGSTDTNGLITVRGVHSSDVVLFNALGYRSATAGLIERGKIGICPFPPREVDSMFLDRKVVNSDGLIVIPLMPLSERK